ncbi:hypothetical protein [Neotabrizicola sp. VNH66]|uniref:hypothetical protein n=1 Tax=Neotabrizicola sp. VNH66 TaxID=3400918 RepID=UPI003BFA7DCE
MDIGVFLPNGRNGYMISTATPQYDPTFDMNLRVVRKIEEYGLNFGLSMIKFRGFGGKTGYWDGCLECFTLTAALAAQTKSAKLFASAGILSLPPALVARMAEQSGRDTKAEATSSSKRINLPAGRVNQNVGTLIGSYANVARMLDEMAAVPGTKGIMLSFDDYETGLDVFGQKVQPLMRSRAHVQVAA